MAWHPQILADQLTLSQPRGADYANQIILTPPDFQTFRRPWLRENNRESIVSKFSCEMMLPKRRRFFLPEIIKKKDGVSDRYYIYQESKIERRQSKRPLTASKCISLVRIGGIDEYFSFSKNVPFFMNNSNILTTT